jgi:hypothetical protein
MILNQSEIKAMTYTKPELIAVGQITVKLLGQGKVRNVLPETATVGGPPSQYKLTMPAYEADE